MLVVVAFASLPYLVAIPRNPRESLREVAEAIGELPSAATPIFGYVHNPGDLEFHLERHVIQTRTAADVQRACDQPQTSVLVMQIWLLDPIAVPVLRP